ncbi:Protein of unknown function (Hypoth_ymh) [Sulfobacillus thermosulfidooxidans DSM 9293]|uniref:Conserved hypothetical protein CHP02391 domain-containing protein n=1 Tax=Sulfobacillus thermosulfidooxidans (strain DSM 9293 / VKM B-1269 / AT-1) TaxID=929705 RepID=A0A1W1WQ88_SULTA|nr:TIGR02391 family protein [Sulfobacillus thermosulfidooxidans]SMC07883.1 Protein of unknown function (Hypoth_ymh) [Sulfobacillus thermosulfidooxidans DSM 9293]
MTRQKRQLIVQYLGSRGVTLPCLQAVVTILASPYRCRNATVIFEKRAPGQTHSAVCFAVWDWLDHPVTIIPDGFGTHGGTGGWGLAVALELFKFSKVPLAEYWASNIQFERVASGFPTVKDINDIQRDSNWAPSWPMYMRDFEERLWIEALNGDGVSFPYGLILPELLSDVRGFRDDPETCVLKAIKRLETAIRKMGEYSADLVGDNLISQAMGEKGVLQPKGEVKNEIQSWLLLYRGLIGAIRNPLSHRHVDMNFEFAMEQIIFVDLLLRKLKSDYPLQYEQWQQSLKAPNKVEWTDGNHEEQDDAGV